MATPQCLYQAWCAGLALVLAVALLGSPTGAESVAGARDRFLETCAFGELVLVLVFPPVAGPTTAILPTRIASGEELQPIVLARVQVEELFGNIVQERTVVADDGQPTGVGSQTSCEEVQPVPVEVIRRLVQQQDVLCGAQQARQTDSIALPDGERLQWAVSVRARMPRCKRDVDATFGIPRIEARRDCVDRASEDRSATAANEWRWGWVYPECTGLVYPMAKAKRLKYKYEEILSSGSGRSGPSWRVDDGGLRC